MNRVRVRDGRTVLIRRAAPEDEAALQRFVITLDALSRYQRFFNPLRELTGGMLAHLVRHDPRDASALIAFGGPRCTEIAGLAQYDVINRGEAEAAVLVGERWRRVGVASALLSALAALAAVAGIERVRADILRGNVAALTLAREFGGAIDTRVQDPLAVQVVKSISSSDALVRSAAPMALE